MSWHSREHIKAASSVEEVIGALMSYWMEHLKHCPNQKIATMPAVSKPNARKVSSPMANQSITGRF
jgi:hypothetical protein